MGTTIIPIVILVLVGGLSALILYGARDKNSKVGNGQFDERQLAAQGKGYKLGFFTMIAVGFVIFIAEAILDRQLFRASDAMMITVSFGIGTMGVYCVVRDAYIALRGSAGVTVATMALLFATCVIRGIDLAAEKGFVTDGLLGVCWVFFAMALMEGAIFTALLVKMLLARRDRE